MRKVEADQYPISVRMIMSISTWILQRSRDHAKGYTENRAITLLINCNFICLNTKSTSLFTSLTAFVILTEIILNYVPLGEASFWNVLFPYSGSDLDLFAFRMSLFWGQNFCVFWSDFYKGKSWFYWSFWLSAAELATPSLMPLWLCWAKFGK